MARHSMLRPFSAFQAAMGGGLPSGEVLGPVVGPHVAEAAFLERLLGVVLLDAHEEGVVIQPEGVRGAEVLVLGPVGPLGGRLRSARRP
jgi:hypothetical protein